MMIEEETKKVLCAGGVVLGDSGTIAVVRNRKDTKWFFPKGHVDEGEDLEEAARREIEEETGLTQLEYLDILPVYTRPGIDADGRYTTEMKEMHLFLFSAQQNAQLTPSHEIAEAAWVSLAHIPHELEDTKDGVWFSSVYQRIRKAIQRD